MIKSIFDINNVLITLKAIVVGFIVAIGGWIFMFVTMKAPVVGAILSVLWLIFGLFLWGYLANRFWGWK